MATAIVKYTKPNTATDVTVGYSFDTLSVSSNIASTGVFLTVNPPVQEIAGCTITKGATGSGQSTIVTNVTDGFKYLPVGSTVTLKTSSEGGAVLPSSTTIVSRPNTTTIVVDKESGVTNSSSANASTISVDIPSTNIALAKIQITLNGLGGTALSPVVKTTYFDGSVAYSSANDSNAVDTQTSTKSISVESLLTRAGVQPTNSGTLDISS